MRSGLFPQHETSPDRRRFLRLAATGAALAGLPVMLFAQEEELGLEADHPMGPVSARYAALSSYSDTGTVETAYQWPGTPAVTERHSFETAFRAPRNFFFRFDEDPAAGGDALVIWCDGGPFQSWWKTTGVHEVYDGGRGANAFYSAESPTVLSANLIAPHLFQQAGLYGPTWRLVGAVDGDADQLDGKPSRRIMAQQRVTGVQTMEDRPITVWIDDETGLIVRVLVNAEVGSQADFVDDRLYTIAATANPELSDDRFTFTPPGG